MKMLAARSARLMAKALMIQLSSMRPLSMNLSSKARTRTRTAASAKKDEQRCAEMAIRSMRGEGRFCGALPPPEGTRTRRAGLFAVWIEPDAARDEAFAAF